MQKLVKTIVLTLLTTCSPMMSAAPVAFSINSDSGSGNADSLYEIDLDTRAETRIGTVQSLGSTRIDVEGLAIAPDGTLYGVDDSSMTLFPINPETGTVQSSEEEQIKGLPTGGGNDFGMTFACDGTLYITSVAEGKLFSMDLQGNTTEIGSLGNADIVALAAYGNPTKLYGLGKGTSDPGLFEINTATGTASQIGSDFDPNNVDPYTEGGLAFDDSGQLWAITDSSQLSLTSPSQTMKIDLGTGVASEVSDTSERGFESLAITVPRGCGVVTGDVAQFLVQKQFMDGNDQTEVTLNIECSDGQPVEPSATVLPNEGALGQYEFTFLVENLPEGGADCEIWESELPGYSASYRCHSEGQCWTDNSRCVFNGAQAGKQNHCIVSNYQGPVSVQVSNEWVYGLKGEEVEAAITLDLICEGVSDGDGAVFDNTMRWSWNFDGGSEPVTASIVPGYYGKTRCRTEVSLSMSSVESMSSCDTGSVVLPGQDLTCAVTNIVFFERIPTLSRTGLLIFSALMLLTGAFAYRRI
jgi:hypothetical protein